MHKRFRALFENKRSLKVGDLFPNDDVNSVATPPFVALFISVHCKTCLDILQTMTIRLVEFKRIIIFCKCDEIEKQHLVEQYKIMLPIVNLPQKDFESKYLIPSTPFAYLVTKNFMIEKYLKITTYEDLILNVESGIYD